MARDKRGRPIIKLTPDALQSLKTATETIGHELHHISEMLAGAPVDEDAAERAAESFWRTYLARARQAT